MTLTTKQELKNNWVVLVVAFLLVLISFGIPNFSLPYIYKPAMDEFGWSNAQVNLISTAKFLVGAVAALSMGIMIDKIGGKFAVLLGTLSGGVAMLLFYYATNLGIYYLAGGMLGLSAASIVAAMKVVVSRLFDINQGLAIGIVLSGTFWRLVTTGALFLPPSVLALSLFPRHCGYFLWPKKGKHKTLLMPVRRVIVKVSPCGDISRKFARKKASGCWPLLSSWYPQLIKL
jgi:MFS family permease